MFVALPLNFLFDHFFFTIGNICCQFLLRVFFILCFALDPFIFSWYFGCTL